MNSYPYANGAIKSLENKVLSPSQIYRLVKLDHEAFIKALYDAGYGTDPFNLETLVQSEEIKTRDLIKLNTPDLDLTNLFFIANDAQNIKVLYKAKLFNCGMVEGIDNGSLDVTLLKEAILEDKLTESNHINEIIKLINSKITNDISSRDLSVMIEGVLYDYALRYTKHRNKSLYHYFQTKIDFTNLLTLARIIRLGWDKEELKQLLIDGGIISRNVYLIAFDKGIEANCRMFKDFYQEKPYLSLVKYIETKDIKAFENTLDQLLIDEMKIDRNDSFGMGPIIYYYLEKCCEAKNIRYTYLDSNIELKELLSY